MMNRFFASLLIVTFLFCGSALALATDNPALFKTEQAAQQHCPNDEVVWLNTKTGVYHSQGRRWYGKTKKGAYVCKAEADQAGDREAGNDQ